MTYIITYYYIIVSHNKHNMSEKYYFDRVNYTCSNPLISKIIGIEPTPKN